MNSRRRNQSESLQDVIIPVMGATGAGKSTFVNSLAKDEKLHSRVGHQLTSCTSELHFIPIVFDQDPLLKNYRIILVDTPGFDDTYEADAAILRRIADWLEKSYRNKKALGGVIYLHDVSSDRFSGTARRNLEMFNHMCGEAALKKVIIGTTKWGRTDPQIALRHEQELKSEHWKTMIASGARTQRFENTFSSALEFVKKVVTSMVLEVCLAIQSEIVDDKKIIPETKAGKELRYTLAEVLEMQKKMAALELAMAQDGNMEGADQKLLETKQKIESLVIQIQQLKIPFFRRLKRFFGFR